MLNAAPEHGYPTELAERERLLVAERRRVSLTGSAISHDFLPADMGPFGMGLSGGGIRSATFCLGVFQGLQARRVLRFVDFLSTVSGGGYWGGCFTALFVRLYEEALGRAATPKQGAQGAAAPTVWPEVEAQLEPRSEFVRFLRENGNYLAPNGGADLFLFGAVLLRNWLALQVMVWALLLFAWSLLEGGAAWLKRETAHLVNTVGQFANDTGLGSTWITTTVQKINLEDLGINLWFLPSLVVLAALMFPLAWSYWTVGATASRLPRRLETWRRKFEFSRKVIDSFTAADVNVWAACIQAIAFVAACLFLEAPLRWFAFWCIAAASGAEIVARPTAYGAQGVWCRIGAAFMLGVVVLLQWFLLGRFYPDEVLAQTTPSKVCALLLGAAVVLIGVRASVFFVIMLWQPLLQRTNKSAAARMNALRPQSPIDRDINARHNLSVWFRYASMAAGLTLLIALLHWAATEIGGFVAESGWSGAIGALWAAVGVAAQHLPKLLSPRAGSSKVPTGYSALLTYVAGFAMFLIPVLGSAAIVWVIFAPADVDALFTLGAATGALSLALGLSRYFLNNSSHLPLYSSRLTRTYLGALPRHKSRDGVHFSPTDPLPGDDFSPVAFWDEATIRKGGAPLHLINVTVNETVNGRTQIANKESKGVGMALGPCAVSLGVRHHVVDPWAATSISVGPTNGGRVFDYSPFWTPDSKKTAIAKCTFDADHLSIGAWIGISGAAVTTGIGWRTNLGLSLLTALTNVRLGHWWTSGVTRRLTLSRFLGPFFWVQQYFLREMFARFPGTSNSLWYLSDGGHFENMGGYELLRRKCRLIVIIDAEADADFEFEGIANLVRKARLDFEARIDFLSHATQGEALSAYVKPEVLPMFGSLSQLGRGSWKADTQLPLPPSDQRKTKYQLETPTHTGLSLANAALARVTYADESQGWFIYIKPTLVGDEPTDVRRYHVEHPTFPHESTGDQFFGEAQFESYRRLGEHIASKLFATGLPLTDRALGEVKLSIKP